MRFKHLSISLRKNACPIGAQRCDRQVGTTQLRSNAPDNYFSGDSELNPETGTSACHEDNKDIEASNCELVRLGKLKDEP